MNAQTEGQTDVKSENFIYFNVLCFKHSNIFTFERIQQLLYPMLHQEPLQYSQKMKIQQKVQERLQVNSINQYHQISELLCEVFLSCQQSSNKS